MRFLVFALIPAAFLASGCGQKGAAPPEMKPVEVNVSLPLSQMVCDSEEFTGRIEAYKVVEIRARATGYLKRVNFKDGALVKEGDLLFEIDPLPYIAEQKRAKAALMQADVRAKRLKKDFARAQTMYNKNTINQEDYERVAADFEEAKAAVEVARANLDVAQQNLDFTRVYAPVTGRISRRFVDPGNTVKADETMLTGMATVSPMYAVFDVDERTVLRVIRLMDEGKMQSIQGDAFGLPDCAACTVSLMGALPGQGPFLIAAAFLAPRPQIPFEFGLADEEGFPYRGVIDFADNRIDTNTGTLRVRGTFENYKGTFAPGLFLRVRIKLGEPRPALLVVERALGSDQGQKFVYVVNDKNEAVYRSVKLGPLIDGRRVVEGLKPNDRVIVNNLQRVRPNAIVRPNLVPMPVGERPLGGEMKKAAGQ
jgi:RND family efflux transporter MFP subunit